MKQNYTTLPLLLAFVMLIFYLPTPLYAQCLCSDGSAPMTSENSVSTNFSSNKTSIFSMPKFDASLGTLVCVNAKAYVTSVLRWRLENEESVALDYRVKYTRWDTVTGPGISPDVTGSIQKFYGPHHLEPTDGNANVGPDFIAMGPDTIYKQKLFEGTTSDVTGYMGTGTVDFVYKTGALCYPDQGGDYYFFGSFPLNKVEFFMTYSYCNAMVLPLNIQNFSVKLKSKDDVSISFSANNESKNTNYEIELSYDASQFRTIGTPTPGPFNGTSTEYSYQYHLDQPVGGKLYFRIKQKTGDRDKYSIIKSVDLGAARYGGLRIYPNPVVRRIQIEFDTPMTGDYVIDLTNQVGQVIFTQKMRMDNSQTLQIDMDNSPGPGIYFLRARAQTSKKVFTGKLLFQ